MQIEHSSQFMIARQPRQVQMQNLRLRGRPPPIIFTRIVRPMNALQLCPWQFSHSCYGWCATSENRSKIGDFATMRSLWSKIMQNFRYKESPPPIIFARLVRPMNALQLCRWQFSQKNFVADFLQAKCIFYGNRPFCVFEAPLGDLGVTYDDHLRLLGKRVVDFLLAIIELFFARCYGWGATSDYQFKIGDFAPFCSNGGRLTQNFT